MVKYSSLRTFYDVEKTIGSGGFGKVKLANHVLTGEKVAIKVIDKQCLGDDLNRVLLEVEALKSISHQHICQLFQFIETDSHFFVIMEYCSGGELFDYIVEKSRLSDAEACTFFRQIVSAVAYLHERGFAHRDIKPENILLDGNMKLKLIDFGLCARPSGGMNSLLRTACGSPHYAAPEIIQGHHYHGPEIDIWSLGVLLYTLLCGSLPFDDDTVDGLYRKIMHHNFIEPEWLSYESKTLIRSMLKKNPLHRITIDLIKQHPWTTMNGVLPPVSSASQIEHRQKERQCIQSMSRHYCISEEDMWNRLKHWKYDYDSATYLVLLARRNFGLSPSLKLSNQINRKVRTPIALKVEPERTPKDKENINCINTNYSNPQKSLSALEPLKRPADTWMTPTRTRRKRGLTEDRSPAPEMRTPTCSKKPRLAKPVFKKNSTPAGKLMRSIEKKISQVKDVVTPKKKKPITSYPALISVKSMCNISTTRSKDPNRVVQMLLEFLDILGIVYKLKKDFRIQGEVPKVQGRGGCSFELEVCLVKVSPDEQFVAIRRKRLNGDFWAYKAICEQVLATTLAK